MYTFTLYHGQKNIVVWRTASISTKMWLDFFARGYHLFREAASFFKFRSRKLNAQTNVRSYNLQARKCDWISLRVDIICFVSCTVFLMFCSRKIAYFEEQIIFMDKFSSLIKVIVFIIPQILLRQNILLDQNLTQFSDVLWFDCLNKKLFSSSTSNTQKQYALPSTLYHTGNIRW